MQIGGVLLLIFGSGSVALTLGCVLFGLGIGNLTSLPPLIVQKEFERADVATAVALIIAINQGYLHSRLQSLARCVTRQPIISCRSRSLP
ncbi:hypothetical protein ACF1BQ_013855 [Bradyrhizobium sp. RDT10]